MGMEGKMSGRREGEAPGGKRNARRAFVLGPPAETVPAARRRSNHHGRVADDRRAIFGFFRDADGLREYRTVYTPQFLFVIRNPVTLKAPSCCLSRFNEGRKGTPT